MKITLVILSVLICGTYSNKLSDDLMDDWNTVASAYADECIKESDANPIVAKSMFKDHRLHDEEHMQCYIKCLNDKLKFTKDDGSFDKEKMVNALKHLTNEIMDKCDAKHKAEPNVCKKAYLVALCFSEENYVSA